jgi:hypothetical protein
MVVSTSCKEMRDQKPNRFWRTSLAHATTQRHRVHAGGGVRHLHDIDAFLARNHDWLDLIDIPKLAEDIVAAQHPDWTRTAPRTAAHDFIKPSGGKVEVKSVVKAIVSKSGKKKGDTWIKPGADWLIIIHFEGIKWRVICDCPIAPELWLDPKNILQKGKYKGCLISFFG